MRNKKIYFPRAMKNLCYLAHNDRNSLREYSRHMTQHIVDESIKHYGDTPKAYMVAFIYGWRFVRESVELDNLMNTLESPIAEAVVEFV